MLHVGNARVENRLLALLPERDRLRLVASCDQVELAFGEILGEAGAPSPYVYFPIDSVVAVVVQIDGGARLAVGLIGNEGMLGASLLLGVNVVPMHALVQGSGWALRMPAEPFHRGLERSAALQRELKRYLHVLILQLAQTAACIRFHVVEARLARWLLMTRDRAHSDSFHLTHEFLARMLGVRRVGVTKAATLLQNRKLIRYQRGNVTILDHAGLQSASCSCYEADTAIYARTMVSRLSS
ncbi:MAG TPA: Crp/Fnr family transcriptional regulator [Azoarcus taiwanensis]|nr:Crp/Fnr family transcriptional regulator [Azoarcus taiwanensis]